MPWGIMAETETNKLAHEVPTSMLAILAVLKNVLRMDVSYVWKLFRNYPG